MTAEYGETGPCECQGRQARKVSWDSFLFFKLREEITNIILAISDNSK
jgi:hypothetical protein